jgi:hypothetical protein
VAGKTQPQRPSRTVWVKKPSIWELSLGTGPGSCQVCDSRDTFHILGKEEGNSGVTQILITVDLEPANPPAD